jgi:diphthamide biosynthesis methyltransferase
MADKKISELTAITGANTAATDVFVVVDTSTGQTKKITREELNNAIEQDVLSSARQPLRLGRSRQLARRATSLSVALLTGVMSPRTALSWTALRHQPQPTKQARRLPQH